MLGDEGDDPEQLFYVFHSHLKMLSDISDSCILHLADLAHHEVVYYLTGPQQLPGGHVTSPPHVPHPDIHANYSYI